MALKASIHTRLGVSRPINAAGTYTPLGVSRSAPAVSGAVADALGAFFVIDELQALADRRLAAWCGAEAGTVTHCVAAAITLSIAAAMTGDDPARIAALPQTTGLRDGVVLPAPHSIDYGHPIGQDVRLAGARLVLAGTDDACTPAQLEAALDTPGIACLLLVSSRLVRGAPIALDEAVRAAHARGVPAIIDGAAQDLRVDELLASGADLVLFSGHKYLASPTAGVVVGRAPMVRAVRMQEKGIGRAMKASKEAIVGLLEALAVRESLDRDDWRGTQQRKAQRLLRAIDGLVGIDASLVPDPAGMPFSRVRLWFDSTTTGHDAAALAARLREQVPPIHTMGHELARGAIMLELVPLDDDEIDTIAEAIGRVVTRSPGAER